MKPSLLILGLLLAWSCCPLQAQARPTKPSLAEQQAAKARLLEQQAAALTRMAEDALQAMMICEKQARLARQANQPEQARQLRQQALQHNSKARTYLEQAQDKLKRALFLRRALLQRQEQRLQQLQAQQPTTLRIASWNIQNFGPRKQHKKVLYRGRQRPLPAVIADIIQRNHFDVIALQEIEGDTLEAAEAVLAFLNRDAEIYRLTYPEKLGSSPKRAEYLPILFNNRRLKLKTQGMLRKLAMQRPPHYAFLQVRPGYFQPPAPGKQLFDFILVSVHLAPKGTGRNDLPRRDDFEQIPLIFKRLHQKFGPHEDIIVAGDFNCDPNRRGIDGLLWQGVSAAGIEQFPFKPSGQGQQQHPPSSMVQGSRLNDNMIWQKNTIQDWTGRKNILALRPYFGNDWHGARQLSDHRPIWCEFYANQDTD